MFDRCLYFNTTALARRLEREWTEAFKPFDLTPSQAFMLRAVLANPGLLQSELAQLLAISRPTATRIQDGLVARGLIVRRDRPDDSRLVSIHPSAAARKLGPQLDDASASVTKRLKRHLGVQEFESGVEHSRRIRSALE